MPHQNISQFTATASLVQRFIECFEGHRVQSFLEMNPTPDASGTTFETIVQTEQRSWNVSFGIRYQDASLNGTHAFIRVSYIFENDTQSNYTLSLRITPHIHQGNVQTLGGSITIEEGSNLEEALKLVSYQRLCQRIRTSQTNCPISEQDVWKLVDRIASETNRRNSRSLHRRRSDRKIDRRRHSSLETPL